MGDADAAASSPPTTSRRDKVERVLRRALYLPYFLGILWTCSHPIVSIITGELKCRGWYIDEHSLETNHYSSSGTMKEIAAKLDATRRSLSTSSRITNLCDTATQFYPSLNSTPRNNNIQCLTHDNFQLASINPLSGAVQPTYESIVLVVPFSEDWSSSSDDFHPRFLANLYRLSDATQIQWLAKTILVVTPTTESESLDSVVSNFLDAYMGPKGQRRLDKTDDDSTSTRTRSPSMLPPSMTGSMIRNLIVLERKTDDDDSHTSISPRLQILPQGRRGLLPNMDMVFMMGRLYDKTAFLKAKPLQQKRQNQRSSIYMHPYLHLSERFSRFVEETLKKHLSIVDIPSNTQVKILNWATELANMVLFAYTMAVGPYPSHAAALDRGIDSVTLQLVVPSDRNHPNNNNNMREFFAYLEPTVRALSNLEERLHHSITLYLLPSYSKFVSHSEYLIPSILLALPLVLRAILLLFWDLQPYIHLRVAGWTVLVMMSSMVGFQTAALLSSGMDTLQQLIPAISLIYGMAAMVAMTLKRRYSSGDASSPDDDKPSSQSSLTSNSSGTTSQQSQVTATIHFVTCLMVLYTHVPIVFAHASLGYPFALIWVPTISFWNWSSRRPNSSSKALLMIWGTLMFLVLLVPPVWMATVVGEVTVYLKFVYLPLHVLFGMLLVSKI